MAGVCTTSLLATGLGTSAVAEEEIPAEPDVVVFHGLTPSTGFEEFQGCPVIMGPDAYGQGLCLRIGVSGPLNFGDVDATIEEPMSIVVGLRAGNEAAGIAPYVAVAEGEDAEPERVEGGLLGVPALDPLFDPVDDLAEGLVGAPLWGYYADADIADPDAQIDGLVETAFFFVAFAGLLGLGADEEMAVEDFFTVLGQDAEEFLGDQTIGLPISVQLRHLLFGDDCYIGTPDDRININLTTGMTEPPEGVEPMTGSYGNLVYNIPDADRPEDPISRIRGAGFVDNAFPVPGATGCDPGVGGLLGQDLADPVINLLTGLPSEAGNNVADFTVEIAVALVDSVYEKDWAGTPSFVDLGQVVVGESSAPETIVIENTGDRPIQFGQPTVGAPGNHFTFDTVGTEGNTCTGTILGVRDQCHITVRGTPRSAVTSTGSLNWLFFTGSTYDGPGLASEPVVVTVTGIA